MKSKPILTTFFLLVATLLNAQNPSLDTILHHYYLATGIDHLQKVQSVVMQGLQVQQDVMPLKISKMRPDFYLMEFDVADLTAYQGFDGSTAWMTTPWTGNPKPQVMPEERAKAIKNTADFDGVLYNWKTKGHQAELVGLDTVENSLSWKIKLTLKEGSTEFYFIGKEDFFLKKKISFRTVRGKSAEIANYFRDYKNVEGIWFPFIIDATMDGYPYTSSQFDAIELNQKLDQTIFSMPK